MAARALVSRGSRVFDVFNVALFCLIGLVMLFPFWNVVSTSFVTAREYYARPFVIIPWEPTLAAYRYLFSTNWIGHGFLVSAEVTVLGTIYNMFLVVTAAYALTKRTLPGRRFFNVYFLLTLYFSGGLVPYYLVVSKYLHLYNSLAALIITSGVNVWNLLVLRTFFRELPPSLAESAIIDGANEAQILLRIILPLSLPALATLTLFTAVSHWNEWTRALYFINDENRLPLQNVLQRMLRDMSMETRNQAQRQVMDKAYQNLMGGAAAPFDVAIKLATVTVTTVPIVCVYPLLQRYFVKGVLIGAVKG